MQVEQCKSADFFAAIAAQEIDQAMSRGDISPYGMWAAAAIMGEMASPARCKRPRRMPFPL